MTEKLLKGECVTRDFQGWFTEIGDKEIELDHLLAHSSIHGVLLEGIKDGQRICSIWHSNPRLLRHMLLDIVGDITSQQKGRQFLRDADAKEKVRAYSSLMAIPTPTPTPTPTPVSVPTPVSTPVSPSAATATATATVSTPTPPTEQVFTIRVVVETPK
jgi:hypothetical protein